MDYSSSLDFWLQNAAETFGTPSYVYVASAIEQRAAMLRAAFGDRFALSFAAKSNPNPVVLDFMRHHVEFLDVSSIGEFRTALAAGWLPERISFTGPGKRGFEIGEAIEGGVGELILESLREAVLADEAARKLGRVQRVLIRIAPPSVPKGFGDQMAGRPSAFGIDWEVAAEQIPKIAKSANLQIVGLHIYSGTQCLKAEAVCENYRNFLQLFGEAYETGLPPPEKLIFGSGLGIPYHDGDLPLDLGAVVAGISTDLDAFTSQPRFADTRLVLELGRYLIGEAGYFLTRVIAIKESRGVRIGICDGGMNNHLPASGHFGMVMHRNYAMHKVGGYGEPEKINLVGPLCTSIDRLAIGVVLPRIEEGDLVAVHNSGAYGLTASPIHFISHAPPCEVMAEAGGLRDITYIPALPLAAGSPPI